MEVPHDDLVFEIALIAGDFISNLRFCLDHLAWQLALHTTNTPSRDICFPICEKDSLDTQIRIAKSTFGIPEAAIAVMKEMQPYHSGDAYQATHLWRLNTLWNIDKHRHVTSHGVHTNWLFKTEGINDPTTQFAVEEIDQSVNSVTMSSDHIFMTLRQKIESGVSEGGEQKGILEKLEALERAQDSPAFSTRYAAFISAAANHMTVIGPFIPALTEMLHKVQR